MSGLHVHGNLGLHLCVTFINSFFDNTAPKSSTVTWLTLLLDLQKSTSQASGELAQLKEEMAASKAEFEKKIKDLEAALANTAKDNAELKQTLEKEPGRPALPLPSKSLASLKKTSRRSPTGLVKW